MKYEATVDVSLKKGVLDPEAATIERALKRLGFDVDDLSRSERFIVELQAESEEDATKRLEEMCERLLTNPVIHDYFIEVSKKSNQ